MLRRLHAELEEGPPVDEPTRALLATVLEDLRRTLDREPEGRPAAEPPSIAARLRDATGHLEETHPRITAAVEELADALTSIFR